VKLDTAFAKTALGRSYLEQPPVPGSRGRRSLLIMMDGRKTVLDLLPALNSLGLKIDDVEAMVAQGLLAPAPGRSGRSRERELLIGMMMAGRSGAGDAAAGSGRKAAAVSSAASDDSLDSRFSDTLPSRLPDSAPGDLVDSMPASLPVPAAVEGAVVSFGNAAPAPAAKWLRVAKLFAQDLLTHMLGRPGSDWHDRLQAIDSPATMLEWVDDCALYLAAVAGPERSDRFRVQVVAFVPAAYRGGPGMLAELAPGRRPMAYASPAGLSMLPSEGGSALGG
jgi:hypothetical protein